MKKLILGGVKSGKSRYAEQQAINCALNQREPITLIATATALDKEMALRIERHKSDRPDDWRTIEAPIYLARALETAQAEKGIIIIDCLTLWLTNLLMRDDSLLLEQEVTAFESALENTLADIILVSNETNMGIMPLGDITRKYCDQAGLLHQRLAAVCDQVELVVAGLPLKLK